MTDEELFGPEVCAQLDAFADAAPDLDESQVAALRPLFQAPPVGERTAA